MCILQCLQSPLKKGDSEGTKIFLLQYEKIIEVDGHSSISSETQEKGVVTTKALFQSNINRLIISKVIYLNANSLSKYHFNLSKRMIF